MFWHIIANFYNKDILWCAALRSVSYAMLDKKMTAIMMTLSMLAAAFAGCLGGR